MGVKKVAGLGRRVRVTQSVALWFIWSSCQILPLLEAKATSQCVQVGQVDTIKDYDIPIEQRSKFGPFTIGGKHFQCKDCSRLDWLYHRQGDGTVAEAFADWVEVGVGRDNFDKGTCRDGFKWSTKYVRYIYTDVCSTKVDIRTYLVRQNGKILRGWLYIEVQLKDPTDEMEYIYVQVRDEAFNAIGEFVSDDREQCSPSPEKKKDLISPTQYQILPCSATGKREAKTANALFMAKHSQYWNTSLASDPVGYVPKRDLTKGIYFTWRLNEYWCNRHHKIRVDANVWTSSVKKIFDNNRTYYLKVKQFWHGDTNCGNMFDKCRLQRKVSDYLHPRWFGAADIKVDGELNCATPVFVNSRDGALHNNATSSWIGGSSKLTVGEDYLHPETGSHNGSGHAKYKGCQVDPYHYPLNDTLTFGGRCQEHNDKKVNHSQTQGCNNNSNSEEFKELKNFTYYSVYSKDLFQKRTQQCKQTCEEPNIDNPEDLKLIKSFPKDEKYTNWTKTKPKASLDFRTLTQSRLDARSSVFWPTRKYHGIVCVICVMFIMPVSIFFIRYYKETFMSSHTLGCGPWFWLHLLMPFAVLTLYLSGHKAMEQPIQNFGTSQSPAGNLHRVAGKGFIFVFFAMAALGVFRPVGRTARAICCALHSVIGFSLYILSVFLVVNSTFIPGSPSVGKCDAITKLPMKDEYSLVAKIPVVWLGIDIAFHCLMTAVQFAVDRRYQLKRPGCGLPFIPILPADSQRDLVGARFRKLMLLLYVTVSLTLTLITTHHMFVNDDRKNCTLGVMSCDLSETRPNQKSSPFGCNVLALNYYNKFVDKYNISMK